MKPVYQTRYKRGEGNCLPACIASILEVPIESIPDFCSLPGYWATRLFEWCEKQGLLFLYWDHADNVPLFCNNAYLILSLELEGIKDEHHAVVGKTSRIDCEDGWQWQTHIIHDPNEYGIPPIKRVVSYILIAPSSFSWRLKDEVRPECESTAG